MNKHAASHKGFTFTRNSKGRTYSHAVLVARSIAADLAEVAKSARYDWKLNLKYYADIAAGTSEFQARKTEEDVAYAKARIEGGVEAFVESKVETARANRAGLQTLEDGDTYFVCAGWCGRLDLAEKLAASFGPHAIIIEAKVEG